MVQRLKNIGKPFIPMVDMWKTIKNNGSLVNKTIEKQLTTMVFFDKNHCNFLQVQMAFLFKKYNIDKDFYLNSDQSVLQHQVCQSNSRLGFSRQLNDKSWQGEKA